MLACHIANQMADVNTGQMLGQGLGLVRVRGDVLKCVLTESRPNIGEMRFRVWRAEDRVINIRGRVGWWEEKGLTGLIRNPRGFPEEVHWFAFNGRRTLRTNTQSKLLSWFCQLHYFNNSLVVLLPFSEVDTMKWWDEKTLKNVEMIVITKLQLLFLISNCVAPVSDALGIIQWCVMRLSCGSGELTFDLT